MRVLQTRTGAGGWSGANFGMFAAVVCMQAMFRVLGPAQKLPAAAAEATTKSGDGVRAIAVCVCVRVEVESAPPCEGRNVTFECIDA